MYLSLIQPKTLSDVYRYPHDIQVPHVNYQLDLFEVFATASGWKSRLIILCAI